MDTRQAVTELLGRIAEGDPARIAELYADDAVVLGTLCNTAKPTGRCYAAAFALHLTVRDGLVTRHHVYEDSLAVARAFGYAG